MTGLPPGGEPANFVNAGEVNLADITIAGQEFLNEALKD